MTDFKKNLKALVLLLGLAVAMPFSAQAQTTKSMYHEGSLMDDPTAKWHSQGLMNDRTTYDALTFSVSNNGIGQPEAPLGSGLLILGAAGAGYAIAKRRKNSKKNVALILAALMLLGFTQCKKEVVEPVAEGTTYHISIPAGGNNSRANVNPTGAGTYATVDFEAGDVIYVGYNNAYVGSITYNASEGKFEGDITTTIVGTQPLHLYFLGGKGFTPTIESNTATVIISDQSSQYPVISYAPTKTNFDGTGSYEAKLLNKCSIMKFNVTTPSTAAVCITGMNNKVTVDFSKVAETGTGLTGSTTDNGFTYSQDGTGVIKMRAKDSDNATWAIVLPQVELDEGGANSVYSTDGYAGTRPAIHAIESNKYYNSGIAMTIADAVWDGDLAKLTSSSTEEFATARDGMTIYGTLGVNKKVSIADGATVTLNNVTINGTDNSSYNWAGITCLGDATIVLNGTNTVKGFYKYHPGIYVPESKTLTIQGTGTLNASSNGWACGIGGGLSISCGNIEIQGGTITATGGYHAAGIGSGGGYSSTVRCGTITISGGNVTAIGGSSAAGIGSGNGDLSYVASCGNITISGGTVKATGGQYGAGIGTGHGSNASCGDITITSGVTCVIATKGSNATNSIGAGLSGTCGTVTIGGSTGAITTSPYTYPAPAAKAAAEATAEDKGKLIGTDGNIYANVAAATAAGTTAVAKIVYVGSDNGESAPYNHGLALAMSDANGGNSCAWKTSRTDAGHTWQTNSNNFTSESGLQYNDATHNSDTYPAFKAAIANNSTAAPTGCSAWFLASGYQWTKMFMFAGDAGGLITLAGLESSSYWSSSEGGVENAWLFNAWLSLYGVWGFEYKDDDYLVRSCLAF